MLIGLNADIQVVIPFSVALKSARVESLDNALAICSNQSKPINSYSQVKENYNKSLKK